jgi:hypothetical protein
MFMDLSLHKRAFVIGHIIAPTTGRVSGASSLANRALCRCETTRFTKDDRGRPRLRGLFVDSRFDHLRQDTWSCSP